MGLTFYNCIQSTTTGILDELALQCEGVSAKFKLLGAADAAAAAAEGKAKRRRPWQVAKERQDGRSVAVDAALVLLLLGCAVGVTIVVTRQVLLGRLAV